MIINHQSDKFKGNIFSLEKSREILYKRGNFNCDIRSLILDHQIIYCISKNTLLENLRLLKPSENRLKTAIDMKIIRQLKKERLIESITRYSMELLAPQELVIKRYKELWIEFTKNSLEIRNLNSMV